MTPHSSILAWKVPRTEEPGGLPTVHGVAELDPTVRTCAHRDHSHGFQLRSRRREVVGYCGTQKPADMCPELS